MKAISTHPRQLSAGPALWFAGVLLLLTSACASMPASAPAPEPAANAVPTEKDDYLFAAGQFNAGNYPVAEFYLRRVLLKNPNDKDTLRLLPWALFFQKRYDKALTAFTRMQTFYPRETMPWLGKAWAHFAMNQYPLALENFDKAESLQDPLYLREIHKGRGFTYLKLHQLDPARKELAMVYTPDQLDQIRKQWEEWNGDAAGPFPRLVSVKAEDASLFHLNVDQPRYPSLLLPLAPAPDVVPVPAKEDYSTPPSTSLMEPLKEKWRELGSPPPLHTPPPPTLNKAWDFYDQGQYKMAREMFEKLPPSQAVTLDGRNGLAWSHLRSGEILKAEKIFKELLRAYPAFPGAREGLAAALAAKADRAAHAQRYLDLNKLRLAANQVHALMREFPEWPHGYSQLGWIELKNANPAAARANFRKALALDSEYDPALKGMQEIRKNVAATLVAAQTALERKDYKTAAHEFWNFIENNQHNAAAESEDLYDAHIGLGWSHYHRQDYNLAVANFAKALKLNSATRFEASRGLGFSYYQLQRYDLAAQHLLVADAERPYRDDVMTRLDWSVLRSHDPAQAAEFFRKVLADDPLRGTAYLGMGWLYYKYRQHDLGVEYFLKAIALDPDFVMSAEFKNMLAKERFGWQLYNQFGWAFYERGENDKALAMFNAAYAHTARKPETLKGIAFALYKMGHYRKAIDFLSESLRINPDPHPVQETIADDSDAFAPVTLTVSARSLLARSYMQLGHLDKAGEILLDEARKYPGRADVHDGLGWVYLKQNRISEAQAEFIKALRQQPLLQSAIKGLNLSKQTENHAQPVNSPQASM